jgi:hypothetical protein
MAAFPAGRLCIARLACTRARARKTVPQGSHVNRAPVIAICICSGTRRRKIKKAFPFYALTRKSLKKYDWVAAMLWLAVCPIRGDMIVAPESWSSA